MVLLRIVRQGLFKLGGTTVGYNGFKIDDVCVMRGNTKLGAVLNVSLPPPKTCGATMPCFRDNVCFAMKHAYLLYPETRASWNGNWRALMRNRSAYFQAINEAIRRSNIRLFRWHIGGDIVDENYLVWMIDIAMNHKDVRFLCFTKKYDIAQKWEAMCKAAAPNLTVVLSAWPGMRLPRMASKRWPIAWMRDPAAPDRRIPADAVRCDGGCDKCGLCFNMKPGQSVYFNKH